MSLKDVLKEMENDSGERRNPEKYHFILFGTSSNPPGTWGWRVEGHPLSQNYISHPLKNATHNAIPSYDDCHEAR